MKLWQAVAILVAVWAVLYLPWLGSTELRGEEARRTLPARTMLETGDWIVPHIGGEIYNRKPPLINWVMAASFRLTGVQNDWTSRLPSVLCVLAFSLVALCALRRRFGVERALMAGIVFLSTFGMLDKGRMAEIEALYVVLFGIAWILWVVWWTEKRTPWLSYTIPWILLGIAVLAKGPLHIAFWYALLVPILAKAQRLKELIHPAHGIGLVLMSATFLPWATLNSQRVPAEKGSGLWWEQLTTRLNYLEADVGEWVIHPFEVVANFLPWSIPLILAWWWTRGKRVIPLDASDNLRWNAMIRGSQLGVLIGIGMILITPEGLARFTMPLFAPVAILTIDLWSRLDADRRDNWGRRFRFGALVVMVGAILAGVIGPIMTLSLGYPTAIPAGVAIMILGVGVFLAMRRFPDLHFSAVWCVVLTFAMTTFLVHGVPVKQSREKYRPDAESLMAMVPDPDRKLLIYDPGHLRFLFYVDRPWTEAARIAHMPEDAGYLMIMPEDLEEDKVQRWLEDYQTRELGDFHVTVEDEAFQILEITPETTP